MSVLNTLFLITTIGAFSSLATVLFVVSIWSNRKAPEKVRAQTEAAPTVASAWRGGHTVTLN